jgi:hypothetical protein
LDLSEVGPVARFLDLPRPVSNNVLANRLASSAARIAGRE